MRHEKRLAAKLPSEFPTAFASPPAPNFAWRARCAEYWASEMQLAAVVAVLVALVDRHGTNTRDSDRDTVSVFKIGERGDNVVCTRTSLPPTRWTGFVRGCAWTEKRLGRVLVAESVLAESVKKSAARRHHASRSSVSPMMSNVSSSYRRRARKERKQAQVHKIR